MSVRYLAAFTGTFGSVPKWRTKSTHWGYEALNRRQDFINPAIRRDVGTLPTLFSLPEPEYGQPETRAVFWETNATQ